MTSTRPTAFLFDLDGTLIDTAPDMGGALNELRAEHDLPPLPAEVVRAEVSNGARALVVLGFGDALDDEEELKLRERFLALYAERLSRESRPFPGILELLDELEAGGHPWGVVTNKPARLTEPLLADLGLQDRAACVVSGDTVARRKPHPDPLLHAAGLIDHRATTCVYLGDARRDVEAAQAAGMVSVVVRYGYISVQDPPESWGADFLIATPREVLGLLAGTPEHDTMSSP